MRTHLLSITALALTAGMAVPAAAQVNGIGVTEPAIAIASSMNIGGHLVDVSPLSTIGALCVAALSDPGDARDLFRKMLIWGLSMTLVGAALCQLFANWFAAI